MMIRSMLMRVLLLASLIAAVLAEKATAPSEMGLAIAATLIGAVGFQVALLYLTNHPDDDMRRYTYEIINATTSIFSAVLIYESFDDVIRANFLEGQPVAVCVLANFAHMFFWFLVMQAALAYFSGAIGEPPTSMEAMELNVKSVAILLAQLAGFASISAWGSLQQLDYFNTPEMSFAVLPITYAGQFMLHTLFDSIRQVVALSDDGEMDEFEIAWQKETGECEKNILGLTLSFNLIQAVRFSITGTLPDKEGEFDWQTRQRAQLAGQQFWLYGIGISFACLMTLLFVLMARSKEAEEKMKKHEEYEDGDGDEEEEDILEQAISCGILTMSMAFAWCMVFGTRIWLAAWPQLEDPMLSSIVLTMLVTFGSLSILRPLDMLADADWTGDLIDDAIEQLVKAIALLVGFCWAMSFDSALHAATFALPHMYIAKLLLAILSVCIIAPAWRWYLVPMAVNVGERKRDESKKQTADANLELGDREATEVPYVSLPA
mmetsp:Transcript_25437/g.46185  ORF Transcript_25437/g.46185 Transcript_25437/m.46185 type:complete len:491 (+) Transcript_25437:67-1539(+)